MYHAPDSVEIEIELPRCGTDERAQAPVEPPARIAAECAPRTILRRKRTYARYVRPRPAFVARFLARPEEHARDTAAVADRRLGHDDRDRQEAAGVLEKVAQVELTILRIEEPRTARAFGVKLHRLGNDLGATQRFGDRLGDCSGCAEGRARATDKAIS